MYNPMFHGLLFPRTLRRRMHSFVYRQYEVWGLTAETLVRLAVLSFPSHPFSFDVRHPDGSDMEGWMERVLQLPAFQAEAERVARRYGAGGGKKGQAGLGGGGGGGGGGTNNDGEEKGSGESADAGAARRRRRALK